MFCFFVYARWRLWDRNNVKLEPFNFLPVFWSFFLLFSYDIKTLWECLQSIWNHLLLRYFDVMNRSVYVTQLKVEHIFCLAMWSQCICPHEATHSMSNKNTLFRTLIWHSSKNIFNFCRVGHLNLRIKVKDLRTI